MSNIKKKTKRPAKRECCSPIGLTDRKIRDLLNKLDRLPPEIKWEYLYTQVKTRYQELHEEHVLFDALWEQIMGSDPPITSE